MSHARRFGAAFLALCTFLTIAVLTPQSQASAQQAPDFNCTVTIREGDAVLEFSGTDVGTTANLRDSSGWVATVTGSAEYRVPAEVGQSYHVVLNNFATRVACTSRSLAPAAFSCTQLAIGNDTRLTFSGDIGATANLRNSTEWVRTVTGLDRVRVPAGAEYNVVLNDAGQTVACDDVDFSCSYFQVGDTATFSFEGAILGELASVSLRDATSHVATVTGLESIQVSASDGFFVWIRDLRGSVDCTEVEAPIQQFRPVTAYDCSVSQSGSDAVISFDGLRARTENLLQDGQWIQTINVRAGQVTVPGGADSSYTVRLRGEGYGGPEGFGTATCRVDDSCQTSPILVLCGDGVLLGSTGDFRTPEGQPIAKVDSFRQAEAAIGRQYDIFHDFLGAGQWSQIADNGFPYNDSVGGLLDEGRILFLNWKNPGGEDAWAGIAAGSQDGVIDATAAELAAFGEPMFLTFHHEPEDNIRGPQANPNPMARQQQLVNDYAAAFRHIHDRFDAAGADNVIFVWDVTGFLPNFQWMYESGLYPGDDVIDWVAWNPYNWNDCTGAAWRTADVVFGNMYDWANSGHPNGPGADVPFMIGEFSSTENNLTGANAQSKGDWFRSIPDILAEDFDRIKAIVLFDTEGARGDGTFQFCEWGIDSTPEALAGWIDLASDPRLNRWFD